MILIMHSGESMKALSGCWRRETWRSNLNLFYFMKNTFIWLYATPHIDQWNWYSLEDLCHLRFSFFFLSSQVFDKTIEYHHTGFCGRQQSMNEITLHTLGHNRCAKYLINEYAMDIQMIPFSSHCIILFTRIVFRHP